MTQLNIHKLEKSMKIKVKNKKLFINAFTHKSLDQKINNEKLEFLGDRVIALILSKELFDLYPFEKEGDLDKRFAKLVNRDTCALICWENGIKDFVLMGNIKKKILKKDKKILSDSCEALIGAVYRDNDFNYVKDFVLRLWKNELKKSSVTILDNKTKLQEYSLKKFKKLPVYKLLNFKGPKHNPTFKISVQIRNTKEYIGTGGSKKIAEQNAAMNLLNKIKDL